MKNDEGGGKAAEKLKRSRGLNGWGSEMKEGGVTAAEKLKRGGRSTDKLVPISFQYSKNVGSRSQQYFNNCPGSSEVTS